MQCPIESNLHKNSCVSVYSTTYTQRNSDDCINKGTSVSLIPSSFVGLTNGLGTRLMIIFITSIKLILLVSFQGLFLGLEMVYRPGPGWSDNKRPEGFTLILLASCMRNREISYLDHAHTSPSPTIPYLDMD